MTQIPKISLPRGKPKLNIFADCETFLWTDGIAVWEMRDKQGFGNYLSENCEVVPWLFAALMPRIENKNFFNTVVPGVYDSFVSCEFPHQKFFEFLKEYWELGYLPVIWFHNASYDLTACIETAFKELDPDLIIYFTAKDDSKGFLRGEMESPKYGFKAQFGDTLLYKRISIAEIGRMFPDVGLKGEIPYTMANLYIRNGVVYFTDWLTGKLESIEYEKCMEYVLTDVKLLKEYFHQMEKEKELITIAINQTTNKKVRASTQGVHAKNLLDLWLNKHHNGRFENIFKFTVSDYEGKLMQESLTGGFTSVNKTCFSHICDGTDQISVFDCNSMYPTVMTKGLPCGYPTDTPPNHEYIEWVCIAVKRGMKWKGNMACVATPAIPESKQSHTFETPKKMYVMRNFLEFIKENSDCEIKEYYSKYQRVTHTAGSFVNYLYDLRKNLKDQWESMEQELDEEVTNNEITEQQADTKRGYIENIKSQEKGVKVTLNSLYGKLAERAYLCTTVYLDGKFNTVINDDAKFKCVLTGAYIALTGRLWVYQRIKRVIEEGFKFLYADTDSVHFAYPKNQAHKLEEIFGVNTGELGQWKNEGRWDEFHTPGKKKKYCLINYKNPNKTKIKLSGISEHIYVYALRNELNENPEKAYRDLRYIFNNKTNVLFMAAKNKSVRNDKYDQIIIHPINVSSNIMAGKVTAKCEIVEKGKYKLTIYGEKEGN